MGLTPEIVKKELKRICNLIGQDMRSKEQIALYCDYLQNYEAIDFLAACNDREMIRELAHIRLNIITIEDYVIKYRTARLENAAAIEKKKQREEAEKLIRNEKIPGEVKVFLGKLRNTEKYKNL